MFAYIWVVSRVMWAFFQPHGVSHEKKLAGEEGCLLALSIMEPFRTTITGRRDSPPGVCV